MSLTDKLDAYLALLDDRHEGWFSPRLQPGLTEAELDQMEERFGLRLPTELRELYSWRDGPASFGLGFFPTHGAWYQSELAGDALKSHFDFQRQAIQDAGMDMGELLVGWPISGSDGDFVVVETDGPRAGAVFLSIDVECFRVTNSLSDFFTVIHGIVQQAETTILDDQGLYPLDGEYGGGETIREPGHPTSAWPSLD